MNNYSPAGYVGLLTILSERARKLGYALGLHGSLSGDMDLLAVAWTQWAVPPPDLVAELAKAIVIDPVTSINGPEEKPHGRLAWTLALGAGACIDLSVMAQNLETLGWIQKSTYERAQSLLEEARADNRYKRSVIDTLQAHLNETDVRAGTAERALAVEKHETYKLKECRDALHEKCSDTGIKLNEAREQISRLEKVLSGEALVHSMNYVPGEAMDLKLTHPMQASLVAGFADMLEQSKAENYIEMRMTKGEQKIVVTIQREEKPTPHELRRQAEASLQQAVEALAVLTRKHDTLRNVYDVLSTDSDSCVADNGRLSIKLQAVEGALKIIKDHLYLEIHAGHMPGRLSWLMEQAEAALQGTGGVTFNSAGLPSQYNKDAGISGGGGT